MDLSHVCMTLVLVILAISSLAESRRRHGRWGLRDRWQPRRGRHHRKGWFHPHLSEPQRCRHSWETGYRHHFDKDEDFAETYFEDPSFQKTDPTMSWWQGQHVCKDVTTTRSNSSEIIGRALQIFSKVCEHTDSEIKCTTTTIEGGQKNIQQVIWECCDGWTRKTGEFGCLNELQLVNLVDTAKQLDLHELVRAVESVGLTKELHKRNYTLFAPIDKALEAEKDLIVSDDMEEEIKMDVPMSNVVVVSKQLTTRLERDIRSLLLGHLVAGKLKTSQMEDEQLIETGSPFKSKIRINFYDHPKKLMTANCIEVVSADNLATNGVIHVVKKVVKPVSDTLMDLIGRQEELSYLKRVISTAGLGSLLRKEGQLTVFAPTNSAFRKLDKSLWEALQDASSCITKVLKMHILPNVICSSVIHAQSRSYNLLEEFIYLKKDDNNKLFVNDVQIVVKDIMATNGVLHLIDDVLVPNDALSILNVVKKHNASLMLKMIEDAGLKKEIENSENITLFIPTDEALQKFYDVHYENDTENLKNLVQYHIVPSTTSCSRFHNDKLLETKMKDKKIRINEYSLERHWVQTAQCALISVKDIKACNGVIHMVDKVLSPPTGNIIDVLSTDDRLTTLVWLLKKSGLADQLEEMATITVFAPTNHAFEKLGKKALEVYEEDPMKLKYLLASHLVSETVCCAGVFRSWFFNSKMLSLAKNWITLNRDRHGTLTASSSEIIVCDSMATNGVVHIVDSVIIPRRPQSLWMTLMERFKNLRFPNL